MALSVPAFTLGRLPRITFGAGVFEQVPAIVARNGARAFLFTGGLAVVALAILLGVVAPQERNARIGPAAARMSLTGTPVSRASAAQASNSGTRRRTVSPSRDRKSVV